MPCHSIVLPPHWSGLSGVIHPKAPCLVAVLVVLERDLCKNDVWYFIVIGLWCVFKICVAGCYFALKMQHTPIGRCVRPRCRALSALVCSVVPNAHSFIAVLVHLHLSHCHCYQLINTGNHTITHVCVGRRSHPKFKLKRHKLARNADTQISIVWVDIPLNIFWTPVILH